MKFLISSALVMHALSLPSRDKQEADLIANIDQAFKVTSNMVSWVHKNIEVEFSNGWAKNINISETKFPDASEPWLKSIGDNRFHGKFDDGYACITSDDYEWTVPLMGITSSGDFKLCATVAWFVDLETHHTKDVNCEHGCFPVDDLLEIKIVDFHVSLIDP